MDGPRSVETDYPQVSQFPARLLDFGRVSLPCQPHGPTLACNGRMLASVHRTLNTATNSPASPWVAALRGR